MLCCSASRPRLKGKPDERRAVRSDRSRAPRRVARAPLRGYARLLDRRRGRVPGRPAAGLAGPRALRGPSLDALLAASDRHQRLSGRPAEAASPKSPRNRGPGGARRRIPGASRGRSPLDPTVPRHGSFRRRNAGLVARVGDPGVRPSRCNSSPRGRERCCCCGMWLATRRARSPPCSQTMPTAVHSGLACARDRMARLRRGQREEHKAVPLGAGQRRLLESDLQAWEAGDIDTIVSLLVGDASFYDAALADVVSGPGRDCTVARGHRAGRRAGPSGISRP